MLVVGVGMNHSELVRMLQIGHERKDDEKSKIGIYAHVKAVVVVVFGTRSYHYD